MKGLALAIEIAAVADAAREGQAVDIGLEAERLAVEHPEAEVPARVIAEILGGEIGADAAAPGDDAADPPDRQ